MAAVAMLRTYCSVCEVWLEFPCGAHSVQCARCSNVIKLVPDKATGIKRFCCGDQGNKTMSIVTFTLATGLTLAIITTGFFIVLPAVLEQISAVSGWLLWLFAVFLTFNVAFNFAACSFSDPGAPSSNPNETVETVEGGQPRYWCVPCNRIKPAGTHHCSTCSRCVAHMDHHCVFLNNCVGERNHRYFILYLFWVVFSTGFVALLCIARLFFVGGIDEVPFVKIFSSMFTPYFLKAAFDSGTAQLSSENTDILLKLLTQNNSSSFVVYVLLIASTAVCITVGVMLVLHLGQIAEEKTTIEKMRPIAHPEGEEILPPRGLAANLRDLLAVSKLGWFFAFMPLMPSKAPSWAPTKRQ